jgi:hypothetical protein
MRNWYRAFTAIQCCFQLKTYQSLSQMKYSATAPLLISSDAPASPKDPPAPRSITQVEGTGKRQGAKREGENGMSQVVTMPVPNFSILAPDLEGNAVHVLRRECPPVSALFWILGRIRLELEMTLH